MFPLLQFADLSAPTPCPNRTNLQHSNLCIANSFMNNHLNQKSNDGFKREQEASFDDLFNSRPNISFMILSC